MAGVAAGLAILAGGATALLTLSPDPVSRVAGDCGLIACGAHLPSSATGLTMRSTPQPSRSGHPGHRPASPTPSASGSSQAPAAVPAQRPSPSSPSPTPSPPPTTPGPQVTVSYAVNSLDKGHPGFKAQLAIVNNGTRTVAGWTVHLSLPGDVVTWVGYPGTTALPFAFWQFSGSSLTLRAVSSGEALRPGSSEVVPIDANGTTTAPGGCTFNGSACQP